MSNAAVGFHSESEAEDGNASPRSESDPSETPPPSWSPTPRQILTDSCDLLRGLGECRLMERGDSLVSPHEDSRLFQVRVGPRLTCDPACHLPKPYRPQSSPIHTPPPSTPRHPRCSETHFLSGLNPPQAENPAVLSDIQSHVLRGPEFTTNTE